MDLLSYALGVVTGLTLAAVFASAVVSALKPIVGSKDRCFTIVAGIVTSLAIVKVAMLPYLPGEIVDLRQFEIWGLAMAHLGPAHAYDPRFACMYTPAYLYVLWAAAEITARTGFNLRVMVEIPLVAADLLLALIVYAAARKVGTARAASAAALLVAFNPALIYISTVWGQNDSVLALTVLLSVLMAAERRFAMAWAIAVMAGMIKAQGLMLIPILAWLTLISGGKRDWLRSAAATIAITILIIAPFQVVHPWHFIWDVYSSSANFFPWASVNAFNLMLAMGGLIVLDTDRVIGPVSYFELGNFLFAMVYVLAAWIIWRQSSPWLLFYSVFIVYLGMFTFAPRMHERYLFYAVALMAPLVPTSRTIGALYAALSVTLFLDAAYVFFNLVRVPGMAEGHLPLGPDARFAISIVNVAACVVAVGYGIFAVYRNPASLQSGAAEAAHT